MNKELALMGNILKSNLPAKMLPYKLTFAVTYRCNSRCKTCNIWKKKPENELSLGEIEKIFSEYPDFDWIDITGGEIFLRNDIAEIAGAIIRKCKNLYILHFPTNGLMPELIVKKTEEILRFNPKKLIITVSLDGPKKVHEKIKGIPGGFEKVIKTFSGLRKIRSRNLSVFFGFTISEYNAGMFENTFNAVKKLIPGIRYDDFHINIMHASKHYYGNDNAEFDREKAVSEVNNFLRHRKKSLNPVFLLERKYLSLVEKYLKTGKTPISCRASSLSCFISPSGIVYPCLIMGCKLGSLRDNNYNLKRILGSRHAEDVFKNIRAGRCPQCWTPCEAYQNILANLKLFL
ncbi:MAG: radical SAM protein [Candidatus Woesearchaeota archaeon]|nr:radical SAM protein [Candidatus Woesearchaeota archaeon]